MLVCRIHGARDLRLETTPVPTPGPGEVLVRLGAGGICGSDLHYFQHGRIGSFIIREPLIPGHEASGTVAEIGTGVTRVKPGDRVALSPSRACGACEACRAGRENLCRSMFFLGSASVFPHAQGLFQEQFLLREPQCHPISGNVSLAELAFAEPLTVALHAVARAGSLVGATALVCGAGPIGCLIVIAARLAGAARIVSSDVVDRPLATAQAVGADEIIRADRVPEAFGERRFDVAFEASGSPAALRSCLAAAKRGGVIVQVGSPPTEPAPLPLNEIMVHELDLRGTFRWGREFDWAVRYLEGGRVDVRPLLTGQYPLREAATAFDAALDKS
ncbi:MAG TPA: L-idonate 5-dehydrogenase, partial [Candidatus Sulfotelmatobacter sp.]|nr:L-idonate 5-dehydrogenase [Candidatus Sulfotelmatobacter sp.]